MIFKKILNHFVLSYQNGLREMPNHDRRLINQIVKHSYLTSAFKPKKMFGM